MFENLKPLRHAIVAVIEDGAEILFIERAKGDTYPGYWSGVTGALEPGEDQREAIVRECLEEVGLRVAPVQKVWESMTRRAPFVLHWWQCRLVGPRDVTPQIDEVGAWRWLKLSEVQNVPLMFSDSRYFFRDVYPTARCATANP